MSNWQPDGGAAIPEYCRAIRLTSTNRHFKDVRLLVYLTEPVPQLSTTTEIIDPTGRDFSQDVANHGDQPGEQALSEWQTLGQTLPLFPVTERDPGKVRPESGDNARQKWPTCYMKSAIAIIRGT